MSISQVRRVQPASSPTKCGASRTSGCRSLPADIIMISGRQQRLRPMTAKRTATKRRQTLGLSETQVVHVALANLARQTLPRYEPDDGPLTDEQMAAIRKLVPQRGFVSYKKRLF